MSWVYSAQVRRLLLRATHVALAAYLDSPFGAGGSHGRSLSGVSAHQPCSFCSAGGACRCHNWVGHYLMSLFSSFSPHLIMASLGFKCLLPWWVCLSYSSSLLPLFFCDFSHSSYYSTPTSLWLLSHLSLHHPLFSQILTLVLLYLHSLFFLEFTGFTIYYSIITTTTNKTPLLTIYTLNGIIFYF